MQPPANGFLWGGLSACSRLSGGSALSVRKKALRLSAILLLLSLPAVPQLPQLRSLTGVVTDQRGNALPGAAVQLENTATFFVTSYITEKDGHYHFNRLNDDVDYTVKAKYRTYWSEQKTLSKFDASKRSEINLVIPIE
jgi:hypothetical protein